MKAWPVFSIKRLSFFYIDKYPVNNSIYNDFYSFILVSGGLDEPEQRPYVERDWRFGHYEMEGLQDPLSRLLRFISFSLKRKKKLEKEDTELVLQPLEFSL